MKNLLYLLLVISFVSCEDFFETTLELEEPIYESQLVLSAIFENLETERKVLLSETTGLNENPRDHILQEATITLTQPDGTISSFIPFSENNFSHTATTQPFVQQGEYRISAVTPDGRSTTASIMLPPAPDIVSVNYIKDGDKDSYGDIVDVIDITIRDTPNVKNYYKIRLEEKSGNDEYSPYVTTNDPILSESAIYDTYLLSDDQFDGEEYKIRMLIQGYNELATYLVTFSSISKDQFQYDKILKDFNENGDNPFSTPVQIHTNMENGLGIFAIENTFITEIQK